MSTTLVRSVLLATLSTPVGVLGAQSPATLIWTGFLKHTGAPAQELRYHIPATPGPRDGFRIVTSGESIRWEAGATDVRFSGINVKFRATFAAGAQCDLEAVPIHGYAGSCVLLQGDSVALTLVPPVPGMLLPEHEVALARDAAPPHLAKGVTVYVLGTSGYFEASRGANDLVCMIERPTPGNVWPICQTREASKALLPAEQLRVKLRAAGIEESDIADSLARGYERGRLHTPAKGAMAYMLSKYAWTVDPSTASRGFIGPHLHFYMPYGTNAALGIDSTANAVLPLRLEREGEPDASVVVGVRVRTP